MKYLGIDYGSRHIGLAVSDSDGRVAFPHSVVPMGQGALSAVDGIVKKEGIEKIVIGESRDLSGKANDVLEDSMQFKKDLEELTGLPAEFEPEFFTSSMAARQFAPDDSRKKNPEHKHLDASAAALILQSYLDKTT